MKINIGAGDTKHEGFINLDYDAISNPDYVVDLEKDRLPFDDSTVETVIAHHILEHLGDGYFNCLQELYRVCKHGAVIDVRVPHPRHDSFLADPTHKRPITPIGLQLFSKKFNQLCRKQGYASSRLGDYFNVDFEILDFKYVPDDRCAQMYAHLSQEEMQHYADEHNNLISEIHIRLTVIKDE
jgi:ubiquinone/menaquinone biosynthesis C-methylase UbiE